MSLLARLAGADEAQPSAPQQPAAPIAAPTVHGSMLVRFGAPVVPSGLFRSR
jgi:hypothetical protein